MLKHDLQSYGECEHFMDDVLSVTDYIRKIDPSIVDDVIKGYKQVCYYASLNGSVKLVNKKKGKVEIETFTKWTTVRKLVKLSVYNKSKLKPRPSDVDFETAKSEMDNSYLASISDEEKTQVIQDMEPLAVQWCQVIAQNPSHLEAQYRALTAMATTSFMMKLPQASHSIVLVGLGVA